MKKFVGISIVAAALLFVGCSEKKSEEHQVEQKVEQKVEHKVEHKAEQKIEQKAQKVIEEPLPGTTVKAKVEVQESSQPSQQASSSSDVVEKAKEVVEQKAQEIAQKVQQKAQEAQEKAAALLPGVPAPTKEATPTADSAKGKELFNKCASCHGSDGKRKALGKSAPIAGMSKDELVKTLKEYQAGSLNKYGMGGLMKGQVAGLSEADIEALAAYISSL